ncbi:MAG: hypothetical protein R3F55_18000 [Alphaproteobacteria bacterium]
MSKPSRAACLAAALLAGAAATAHAAEPAPASPILCFSSFARLGADAGGAAVEGTMRAIASDGRILAVDQLGPVAALAATGFFLQPMSTPEIVAAQLAGATETGAVVPADQVARIAGLIEEARQGQVLVTAPPAPPTGQGIATLGCYAPAADGTLEHIPVQVTGDASARINNEAGLVLASELAALLGARTFRPTEPLAGSANAC